MNLKRAYLIVCCLLIISSIAVAQDGKAMAGTWVLENKDPNKRRSLIISVAGLAISIKESFSYDNTPYSNEMTLFLDKRGEKNPYTVPGAFAAPEATSRSSFKNNKLIRTSNFTAIFKDRPYEQVYDYFLTDEYVLSKDGNQLKVKSLIVVETRRNVDVEPQFQTPLLGVMPEQRSGLGMGGARTVERVYKRGN